MKKESKPLPKHQKRPPPPAPPPKTNECLMHIRSVKPNKSTVFTVENLGYVTLNIDGKPIQIRCETVLHIAEEIKSMIARPKEVPAPDLR